MPTGARPERTMTGTVFCTIAARNYLAQARVLAASLACHHPGRRLVVVVVDGTGEEADDDRNRLFDLVGLEEIGLDRQELHLRAMIYDVVEFSTSIKPWLLEHLLDRGAETVVYVDPDIELYAPIDDLIELAGTHDLVLTPSTTAPVPYDGLSPHESDFLRTGLFNLGFVIVAQQSRPFLRWWMPRLRRDCVRDEAAGYFVDQRWLDLAPFYFRAAVVCDPGCNVAWWNLAQRGAGRDAAGPTVGGAPLRFFHFSSFDPRRPATICTLPLVRPLRYHLSEFPPVAELCTQYVGRLLAAGHEQAATVRYGFDTGALGLPIDRRMRRIYREALADAEREKRPHGLPDPFDVVGAARFDAWLKQPAPLDVPVWRYLQAVYDERLDLQVAFGALAGTGREAFLAWVRAGGMTDPAVSPELLRGLPDA